MPGLQLSSILCFLLLLLLFPMISQSASENEDVIVTSSGPVKGKHLPASSGSVTAYLGIPYAEPPVGKLRFQKPRPHQPWSQALVATSFANACPQTVLLGLPDATMWAPNRPLSEDCLFLNIWVPRPRPSSPAPVLVWIHGGGFFTGTASLDMYNGAALAASENVLVVSLNYRLGAIGFLSLPPDAPGNMGLLDQQLALKWVQENAAAFGGDPTRVTIFGESAGAASVGFHLLSPGSQPLFAQAVLQSGVASAVWAWMSPEEAKQKALAFGQLLGCVEGNESAVVSCLLGKDATAFAQHEISMFLNSKIVLEIPFSPTTDGEFLPDNPQKLLEAGCIQHKPILLGVTADEGSWFLPSIFHGTNYITWEQLLEGVRKMVRNATEEDVQAVALKYSEEGRGPGRYRWAMAHSLSDYCFVCPAAEFAAKVRQAGSPAYFYSFRHHTSGSFWPEWAGVPHGAELPYVFGTLESAMRVNHTYTEAEAALSRRVMRYWAEFSRTGGPTGSAAHEVEWPLYNATQQNVFCLSTEPPQVMQISPLRHCSFWKRLFPAPNKSGEDSDSSGKEKDGEKDSST